MRNNKTHSALWQKRWNKETEDKPFAPTAGVDNPQEILSFLHQVNLLSDALKLRSTDNVLDIGCNRGLYLAALASRVGHITGIDYAAAPIEEAKKNIAPYANVEAQTGNVLDLPFKDSSFDKILVVSVLQYLDAESVEIALKEIARVLKRGGLAYLSHIPDASKKQEYFDGIEKLQKSPDEKKKIRERNEEITWLDPDKLIALAAGCKGAVVPTSDSVWFSRYAFSVIMEKI